MAGPGKEYVLGKGKLYFDKFVAGTLDLSGERYLGNTPGFSVGQETEALDHIDSDEGINVKDESVTLSNDMTGTLNCDNISLENVAAFFGGDSPLAAAVAMAASQISTFDAVKLGLIYQIGRTTAAPMGARKISTVVVTQLPSTVIDAEDNYTVDLLTGRLTILADAVDIEDGDDLSVSYTQTAYDRTVVVGKGQEIAGTLRFIATNPVGPKKDYFFPYVKLKPNGDYELKGDDWQAMEFAVEVLKLDSNTERLYIEEQPAA